MPLVDGGGDSGSVGTGGFGGSVERPPRAGKACNDWSERRPHLAGRLAGALARRLFELDWIARTDRAHAVEVTATGRRELGARLGI